MAFAATKEQSAAASRTASGAKEVESAAVAALLGEVESVLRKPIPSNVDLRDLGGSLGTSVLEMDRSFLDSRHQCDLLVGALAAIAGERRRPEKSEFTSTYPLKACGTQSACRCPVCRQEATAMIDAEGNMLWGEEVSVPDHGPWYPRMNVSPSGYLQRKVKSSQCCGVAGCKMKCSNRCGRCKSVMYCSREHQKQHWKTHKVTCKSA